jgi:hypothetical protein
VDYIKKAFNDLFITNLVKTIAKHHRNEAKQDPNKTISKILEKEKKLKEEAGIPEDDERLFLNNKTNSKEQNGDEEVSQKEDDDNEEEEEDDYNISKEEIEAVAHNSGDEEMKVDEEDEVEGKMSIDNIYVEVIFL